MKTLPYYPMYPSDFDADENVRAMDLEHVGLYVACLNHSWRNNGLPSDLKEAARVLRISPTRFRKLWNERVGKCFETNGDRMFNPRQERERNNIQTKSRKCVDAVQARYVRSDSVATE